jgi:DNA-binding Lrp family transcriptional regulator
VAAKQIDDIDRALLGTVQANADLTLHELGDLVGLSPAAVQRRLRRLRDSGVVTRSSAVLDPVQLGVPILVLTLVTLERDPAPHHERFISRVVAHPNIQQCYELAGNFDLALFITAPDMQSYREITSSLLDVDPNVRRYASHVTMRPLKRSLDLPV